MLSSSLNAGEGRGCCGEGLPYSHHIDLPQFGFPSPAQSSHQHPPNQNQQTTNYPLGLYLFLIHTTGFLYGIKSHSPPPILHRAQHSVHTHTNTASLLLKHLPEQFSLPEHPHPSPCLCKQLDDMDTIYVMKQILLQTQERSQKSHHHHPQSATHPHSMDPSNKATPRHWWDWFRRCSGGGTGCAGLQGSADNGVWPPAPPFFFIFNI